VPKRQAGLSRESLELARLLLESAAKLHSAEDPERARQAYQKALMIYEAAERPQSRRLAHLFAEVGGLLGVAPKAAATPPKQKPARSETRKLRSSKARA
jgi:hypothetical protein